MDIARFAKWWHLSDNNIPLMVAHLVALLMAPRPMSSASRFTPGACFAASEIVSIFAFRLRRLLAV